MILRTVFSNKFLSSISFTLNSQSRRFLIYSIFLIISVIFLSLTLAIGFLLPSNHHVLHCRCQTYYVICLLCGDLLLAINQSTGSLITGILCLLIGKFGCIFSTNHFEIPHKWSRCVLYSHLYQCLF